MIALVTTYFLIFYILVPGVLFRFLTSWFVPLKLFERTRTQQATFAVTVAILPFAIALFGVWNLPVMRHYPFPIAEGTAAERTQDYQRVTSILTASDASRLLLDTPTRNDANWRALNRVIRRQACFLAWYFVLIALEGVCFGLLARRYGDWREQAELRAPRYRIRLWLIRTFILPNISEWHLLLTSFNWPRHEDVVVTVDIQQNDGILYQGRVADYFLDPSGKLTGILLEHVSRFEREAYHEAQKTFSKAQPISSAAFWRSIPGSRFYIDQSSILNLNVRFVARDQTLISLAETILDAQDTNTYEVTVESEEETSQHPDIYS